MTRAANTAIYLRTDEQRIEAEHRRRALQKFRCEKLVDGRWVTTAWAPDTEAAERHCQAIGEPGETRWGCV